MRLFREHHWGQALFLAFIHRCSVAAQAESFDLLFLSFHCFDGLLMSTRSVQMCVGFSKRGELVCDHIVAHHSVVRR